MRALVVALVIALAAPARADTIVFVGDDAELVQALASVMEGNNTGVTAIGDRPTPSLADLGPESRRLADERSAIATVWLSPTAAGATLVTYERSADRFVVREVPYKLPLDATQAAETARMVRVMLLAVRERNDEGAVTKRPPLPPPPAEPLLVASLGAGAWFAPPEGAATPMTTLLVAYRPHGLGAAISATLAPSSDFETMTFTGDVGVFRLAAEARLALEVSPHIRITPGLGIALHAVTLGGELAPAEQVHSRNYDPALYLSAVVGIALPHRIELGLGISADCLLQRQVYATGTEQILEVPRFQGMMALLFGVRL